jgi:hypothetical protein
MLYTTMFRVHPIPVNTVSFNVQGTPHSSECYALPCSGPEDELPTQKSTQAKWSRKKMEAPRAQQFLHCEYLIFPGDLKPVQTDIVLHGRVAAKIFTDQLDAKIVQAWSHGDATWVSWSSWLADCNSSFIKAIDINSNLRFINYLEINCFLVYNLFVWV